MSKNLRTSDKHFWKFYLDNTAITELKENTFSDITFDDIFIYQCTNLTKINPNAFNKTRLVTKSLTINNNPVLSSPDNSIFEMFTKFVNLQTLYVQGNNITEIPTNAFRPTVGNQDKLTNLHIIGDKVKKIGDNAFASLNSLQYLGIFDTSIDSIPEYAFNFEKDSVTSLTIALARNTKLTSAGFHKNSLIHIKRATFLGVGNGANNFEYLDETTFMGFLNQTSANIINMLYTNMDCNNCKNYWLRKHPKLLSQLYYLKCSNGKQFDDPANFSSCKS